MRYLMLQLGDRSADAPPAGSFAEAMRGYEDDLRAAGIVLASETLPSSSTATSIRFESGRDPVLRVGPARDAGLAVRAFRIVEVRTPADAIAWARRCPLDLSLSTGERAEIEIHPIGDGLAW